MRVVLDTNVLVSFLVFPGGPPEAVVRLALEEQFELVSSNALLSELAAVLAGKFGWKSDQVQTSVFEVAEIALMVQPARRLRVVRADPADDRVLEAAAAGRAEVIVSGDHHLLELKTWRGIRIVKPAAFLAQFGS